MNTGFVAVPLVSAECEETLVGSLSQDRMALNAGSPVFGLHMCTLDHGGVADMVLNTTRTAVEGAGIVATANIQHIAIMRYNEEFRTAMQQADLVTCDGFPVFRYAQHRGCDINTRTTGRDIVYDIMCERTIAAHHRLFFVVDTEETAMALEQWAQRLGIHDQVTIDAAPEAFIRNPGYCATVAEKITAAGTTLLMMCVGAPQSEIFAQRYRHELPPCWILCVGQSAKIVLGLAPLPPRIIEKLSIEWLWRIVLEPRRLFSRYASSSIGFVAAVLEDARARHKAA
jgi:N-acetylglucosaminyldiphosphoundecaprenol N-acetyl-beta-D-mannosaminyltransferase